MIKVLGNIPNKVILACSGGPDSMAAADFLTRGKRDVSILHFDHGTQHSHDARSLVENFCTDNSIDLTIEEIKGIPGKGESFEKWWRDRRYEVFHEYNLPVITAHNLNDVAEWWMFTSLRGNPRIMPYRNKNVFRPFLITKKSELEDWCDRNSVPFVIDPTNFGDRFSRSLIRKNIIPEALRVAPGFLTTMSNKVKEIYVENKNEI